MLLPVTELPYPQYLADARHPCGCTINQVTINHVTLYHGSYNELVDYSKRADHLRVEICRHPVAPEHASQ